MGPVMAVVMVMVLMLGLEVTVWADEDDDEKAEMRDFVAAVYRGQGQYNMAGSIATERQGIRWFNYSSAVRLVRCWNSSGCNRMGIRSKIS